MRAIVLPEYGPPSALQLRTLPDPQPGAKEIVVRMAGASLNPVDWKQRSGVLRQYMPLSCRRSSGGTRPGRSLRSDQG